MENISDFAGKWETLKQRKVVQEPEIKMEESLFTFAAIFNFKNSSLKKGLVKIFLLNIF